jgi:hypothetical protein
MSVKALLAAVLELKRQLPKGVWRPNHLAAKAALKLQRVAHRSSRLELGVGRTPVIQHFRERNAALYAVFAFFPCNANS